MEKSEVFLVRTKVRIAAYLMEKTFLVYADNYESAVLSAQNKHLLDLIISEINPEVKKSIHDESINMLNSLCVEVVEVETSIDSSKLPSRIRRNRCDTLIIPNLTKTQSGIYRTDSCSVLIAESAALLAHIIQDIQFIDKTRHNPADCIIIADNLTLYSSKDDPIAAIVGQLFPQEEYCSTRYILKDEILRGRNIFQEIINLKEHPLHDHKMVIERTRNHYDSNRVYEKLSEDFGKVDNRYNWEFFEIDGVCVGNVHRLYRLHLINNLSEGSRD